MSAPLVMIPGIGGDAAAWLGMPDGEIVLPAADTIADMADEVLARAPARFAVAGHSMGGYVALMVAARAPERVDRLALLSTSALPDTAEQRTARLAMMDMARGDYPAVAEILIRAMVHRDARADAGLTADLHAMLLRVGADTFLRQQTATLERPDMRPILPSIAMPTLILHGEADRVVASERSREIAAVIPHARLVIIPRCGHLPQREHPSETKAAMAAWLEEGV